MSTGWRGQVARAAARLPEVTVEADVTDVDGMFRLVQAAAGPDGDQDLLVARGERIGLASSMAPPASSQVLITRREIATLGLARHDDGSLAVPACAVVFLLVRERHEKRALGHTW